MLNNAHCGDVDDDEDDDEDDDDGDEGTSTVYKVTQVPKTRTHSCHTHTHTHTQHGQTKRVFPTGESTIRIKTALAGETKPNTANSGLTTWSNKQEARGFKSHHPRTTNFQTTNHATHRPLTPPPPAKSHLPFTGAGETVSSEPQRVIFAQALHKST